MMQRALRKRVWIGSLVVLLLLAGTFFLVSYFSEPRYQGRRLRYWLSEYQRGNPRAEEAVRTIGPKAVPALLEMLFTPEPRFASEQLLEKVLNVQLERDYSPTLEIRSYGALGFRILGAEAASAIPELTRILTDDSRAHEAWEALTGIGAPAMPVVEQFLAGTNRIAKKYATFAAISIGAGDEAALMKLLKHPDPNIRADAFIALPGYISRPGFRVYDHLLAGLDDPNELAASRAATALRLVGDVGTNALPRLYQLADTTNALLAAEIALSIKYLEKRIRLQREQTAGKSPW